MRDRLMQLAVRAHLFLSSESGADLVEYALVIGCMALGTAAAMQTLAQAVTTEFSNVGAYLEFHT